MTFSFLGGLANLLPGYVQGQRQAIQDNWQDLMNYNQVQSGQLSNAFTEATWQPRLDMFQDALIDRDLQTFGNLTNARLVELLRPGHELEAMYQTWFAPQTAPMGPLARLQMGNMVLQNPRLGLAGAMRGSGSTPSNVR